MNEKIAAEEAYTRGRGVGTADACPIENGLGRGVSTMSEDHVALVLEHLFKYHPPTPETLPKYKALNQAAKNFAAVVMQFCPPGADRTAAVEKIIEAKMTANKAVALDGFSL